MAYIGKTPVIGNFQVCDAISVVDAQAAYTMQVGGVNVSPESANHMIVSLNGVIQKPTDAYTVSGSTITFASNLVTGDVIDFIQILGNVLDLGVPSDGTVTSAKITYPLTTFSSTGIDDNATSTAITIDSSERVGIGTSSPTSKLNVEGTSVIAEFKSTNNNNVLRIKGNNATNGVILGSTSSDDFLFVTNTTERMRIDSSGTVRMLMDNYTANPSGSNQGITFRNNGSTARVMQLGISATSNATVVDFYNGNGGVGTIQLNGSSTAYNTSSDYRLKENVNYDFDATTRLKQLRPARFNFIADNTKTVDGFIAHEVSSVVPEAISGEKDAVKVWQEGEELPEGVSVGDNKLDADGNTIIDSQGIDQSKLVPLLVKTIQELEARITQLENA
jgi:hypothetical protein